MADTARARVALSFEGESPMPSTVAAGDFEASVDDKLTETVCEPKVVTDAKNTHSGSSVGDMVPIEGTPDL